MIRAKVVQEATALAALASAEAHMVPREVPVPQERAVQTAMKYGISAYDAQYVVLAEVLGTTCVTADVPLVRKVPTLCTLLSDFVP
jgi:predicted nucleic acid-binding protein